MKMKTRDLKRDADLEVIVGSPHTAEDAETARKQGLIPIERQGGPRDGETVGFGRVTDAKTGKPIQCSKILLGMKKTVLVPLVPPIEEDREILKSLDSAGHQWMERIVRTVAAADALKPEQDIQQQVRRNVNLAKKLIKENWEAAPETIKVYTQERLLLIVGARLDAILGTVIQ